MTALGIVNGVVIKDDSYEQLLIELPFSAVVFKDKIDYKTTQHVFDYLTQCLGHHQLVSLRSVGNDPEKQFDHLMSVAVSLPEARKTLAELGLVKLSKEEQPPKTRRVSMTTEPKDPLKFTARSINKNQKIKLLCEENPRKKGSKTAAIFDLYKDGMTVAEFIAAGGRLIDVKADVERGHISLAD